ncbi:MAG: hypothetical protein IT285_10845 [Bdellovibrionales bacterium]|nr:hypothetical protein [Bdellovibrionales bacterium]
MVSLAARLILLIPAFLLLADSASAASASNNRTKRRFGVILSVQGEPFPSSYGLNLAYHLSRMITIHAGFGIVMGEESASSLGGGVKFQVPKWNFSPFIGVSYARVSGSDVTYSSPVSGNGDFTIDAGTAHFYGTAGLSYQSAKGIYLAGGISKSLSPDQGGMVFFHIGKFFGKGR